MTLYAHVKSLAGELKQLPFDDSDGPERSVRTDPNGPEVNIYTGYLIIYHVIINDR
jgi:hypothetical protein